MSDPSSSQPPVPSSSQPPPVASQTASQEPPSSSTTAAAGQSGTNSEATVVPKQEPDESTALDASIDQDIELGGVAKNTADNNINMANAPDGDEDIPLGNPVQTVETVDALAATTPGKKETSLREFLGKMDEYAPIIPDAVTAHYLTLAGLPPPGNGPNQTPPHLARLLALATQKFIADIAADSYQYARIRASNSSSASNPMGSLNAASGLGMPAGAAGAGAPAAGVSAEAKGKAGTHLGIQRPGFGGGGSGGSGQGRTVLTMEDLGMAVSEYGVSVKRGEFYR
ncbi:putative TFIID and and SAGA complex TAF10 subunit [Aspergillus affinis]|uniref:putative TFIID and and SAGA complex TAF10 subunit n=1 Tax=Aspergillus affinis TaxID=1070780 RepID=UPI0022FE27E6|nr:transcription initiation factor IID [Aspergillus affinis]KAI9045247.1 transcription initiation factor IID [Aspergillus affinis]